MSAFGEFLKQRRKDLDMTMTDVQTVAGVSQSSMSQYEKGAKVPSKRTLEKLADLYEVSHEEMIKMAEETETPKPPEVKKKAVGVTKVHRFDCNDGHAFFVPLNLPITIEEMVEKMNALQCPVCHCGSKNISINMKEYTVSE